MCSAPGALVTFCELHTSRLSTAWHESQRCAVFSRLLELHGHPGCFFHRGGNVDSAALTSAAIHQLLAVRSLGRHLVCSYLVKSPPRGSQHSRGHRRTFGRNERRAVDHLSRRHICGG